MVGFESFEDELPAPIETFAGVFREQRIRLLVKANEMNSGTVSDSVETGFPVV